MRRAVLEFDDYRRAEAATHCGPREEVVIPGTLAEPIEVNLSTVVARKVECAARVKQRREVELV